MLKLTGTTEIHITATDETLLPSCVDFNSPDAWIFLDHIKPSVASTMCLNRLRVYGQPAIQDSNIRFVQYGSGSVIIPHAPDFPPMTVFTGRSLTGSSMFLQCHVKYDEARLGNVRIGIRSFRLKRGYMATIAQQENGCGLSKNYVAQDHDLEVCNLPDGLDKNIRFIRIFPWRWTGKKGIAGDIWQNFNVDWFYNWNITKASTPDLEYVPIRQSLYWPNLDQDWKARGAIHLLGYNEPDHQDQSNLTVAAAIDGWPDLLATGLRLGSPAVSDGGLSWIYDFIKKADAARLRVDFVAAHYYRSHPDPKDAAGAALQFYDFLENLHERVRRPLWVTEFNNGANWTKDPRPDYEQEKATITKMIEMLDRTPFVERYAIYNWVEEIRNVQRHDGSLTPAGQSYRDKVSSVSYQQREC